MEINPILTLVISIPLQCISILWMNLFFLNAKVAKKEYPAIIYLILLPTMLLFKVVNIYSFVYLLISINFYLYSRFRKVIVFLNVLASFLIAVIADHMTSFISFSFVNLVSVILFITIRSLIFLILLFGLTISYKYIFNFFSKHIINKKVLYSLILLFTLSLLFFYVNIFTMTNSSLEDIKFNLMVFSIYIFLILIISLSTIILSLKQYKIRIKEREYAGFLEYTSLLEQNLSDTTKFRHDYINILTSLRYYIDNNNMQGLKTFFYKNIIPAQKLEIRNNIALSQLNNLKIEGLKGLLTTKYIHAQENGINMDLEIVEEISSIQVDILELNRIVGILLDNAIEASKSVKDPIIRIAFIALDMSKLIVILNKTNENNSIEANDLFREGYSTKGENRGLGLSNLKNMINNNKQILLNTKIEKGYFTQELEIKNEGVW